MTQAIQVAQYGSSGVSLGFKNRIINGDMTIDQRNGGASITPTNGQFSSDRWQNANNTSNKLTLQRVSDAPTGFNYSIKITSTSAYSIGSNEVACLRQYVEGFSVADLDWGLSTAKTVTLSFWVKSSLTGSFGGVVSNDSDRTYPFLYTINSANTWEQKSVTISGQTSGSRNITNGVGIAVLFGASVGSSYLGTPNQWNNANQYGATGSVQLLATNGASLNITGVQLEIGSTASSFETRFYGTELQLCQRYYYVAAKGDGVAFTNGYYHSNSQVRSVVTFPVQMRGAPILISPIISTGYFIELGAGTSDYFNSPIYRSAVVYNSTEVSGTLGVAGNFVTNGSSALVAFEAEM
jgi:hypothetical protein